MNEKTPNVQTQTAMTQAREMARNRMLKLVEPRNGVESFPNFTNRARQRWESIPADIRKRLLSNVWCGGRRQLTWPVDDNYLGRLDLQPGRSGSEG